MDADRTFWENRRENDLNRAGSEWQTRNGQAVDLFDAARQQVEDAYGRHRDDVADNQWQQSFDANREDTKWDHDFQQQQFDTSNEQWKQEFDANREDVKWEQNFQEQQRTWDAAYTAAEQGDFSMLGELTGQKELFDSLTATAQGRQALGDAYQAAQVGDYSKLKALGINTEYLEAQDAMTNWENDFDKAQKIAAFKATYGYDPFDGSPSGGRVRRRSVGQRALRRIFRIFGRRIVGRFFRLFRGFRNERVELSAADGRAEADRVCGGKTEVQGPVRRRLGDGLLFRVRRMTR